MQSFRLLVGLVRSHEKSHAGAMWSTLFLDRFSLSRRRGAPASAPTVGLRKFSWSRSRRCRAAGAARSLHRVRRRRAAPGAHGRGPPGAPAGAPRRSNPQPRPGSLRAGLARAPPRGLGLAKDRSAASHQPPPSARGRRSGAAPWLAAPASSFRRGELPASERRPPARQISPAASRARRRFAASGSAPPQGPITALELPGPAPREEHPCLPRDRCSRRGGTRATASSGRTSSPTPAATGRRCPGPRPRGGAPARVAATGRAQRRRQAAAPPAGPPRRRRRASTSSRASHSLHLLEMPRGQRRRAGSDHRCVTPRLVQADDVEVALDTAPTSCGGAASRRARSSPKRVSPFL